MSSGNEVDVVVSVELLHDVSSKEVACSSWADGPACHISCQKAYHRQGHSTWGRTWLRHGALPAFDQCSECRQDCWSMATSLHAHRRCDRRWSQLGQGSRRCQCSITTHSHCHTSSNTRHRNHKPVWFVGSRGFLWWAWFFLGSELWGPGAEGKSPRSKILYRRSHPWRDNWWQGTLHLLWAAPSNRRTSHGCLHKSRERSAFSKQFEVRKG